nr:reverse transcriptase domain-containing protein [Tanacetum cinerariifolium]
MKQNGVSDDTLRLSLFPYSLTHHATAWYDRLPRNSIQSFDNMMRKFLSKYFPPSTVTKLRNEITNFRQDPNESLLEAWEPYKLSIDRCPNHNMLQVTQIDTFYNALADLGASINLMPLFVWKKLSLPKLNPTCMTLELANRSVAYPVSVAEDVFVKVGKFHFLADFVDVDYDVDPRVPLILERPFLKMARALIDGHGKDLTRRVNDEAITF